MSLVEFFTARRHVWFGNAVADLISRLDVLSSLSSNVFFVVVASLCLCEVT
jgi:hypothetical protein